MVYVLPSFCAKEKEDTIKIAINVKEKFVFLEIAKMRFCHNNTKII